ncbi:MAG: ImmA/IrrE family metallo-endopeptidase, partial [Nitrosomonas sp.]|nr:ImmA/IrrE family metallo-endopeptidase [Nitrosomonas sp.]
FAASILMPEPLVCEIYKELKGDVAEIAKRFQASKQAMQIRIDSIDTLSPVETIVG